MTTSSLPILVVVAFITSLFCLGELGARESFTFGKDEQIHVRADKGYKKASGDMFEAVGNVIIIHGDNATYGEKASVSTETGELEVVGNVRYITPGMTLYGTRFSLNVKTNVLHVENARVITDDYVVFGKKLSRLSEEVFFGEDAEYTTCRDCPESWSIVGKKVSITLGEYVRITHAFIKVKGMIVMYIPYIVFPIKKRRESGLLFPRFKLGSEGVTYKQPWFWNISSSNDLTLTPGVLGSRGFGGEFEYRHVFGESKWFEFNSQAIFDRLRDEKIKSDPTFRYFSTYEHHVAFNNNINHHLFYSGTSDLDTVADFEEYTKSKIFGSELGGQTFLDFRTSFTDLAIESYFSRNLLFSKSEDFDDSYVQILPKVTLSTIPFNLYRSNYPLFKKVLVGLNTDYTIFRQNHRNEGSFIRNASRLNMTPYVDWHLGHVGPVQFKTKVVWDFQGYYFPHERDKKFRKHGVFLETTANIEIYKIFGVAYRDSIPVEQNIFSKNKDNFNADNKSTYIGYIPSYQGAFTNDYKKIVRNSYRHTQEVKLKHYYQSSQSYKGSGKFLQQIQDDAGTFDRIDVFRGEEYKTSDTEFATELPKTNTIELQWNNSIIIKKPNEFDVFEDERYLKQNFQYSKISYFNVSQGYNFDSENKLFKNALTRLYINTGLNLDGFNISLSEYYFYADNGHILDVTVGRNFSGFELSVGLNYHVFKDTKDELVTFAGSYQFSSRLTTAWKYVYDLVEKVNSETTINMYYLPFNKCWKLNLRYKTTSKDPGGNLVPEFSINFNKEDFASFN
ncbi:MAG: LPS-assembly protein LptD [Bacteriovoracaceae bacterium]|nr:LPS-assembly protein LptD [Bacteriovoracaceae bacterium]